MDTCTWPISYAGCGATPGNSPIKVWRGGQYVDCDTYGWDGTKYVPIDISGGM